MQNFAVTALLLFFTLSTMAQRVSRGVILDENENPIVNVKVSEIGSRNEVFTDDEGHYMLSYFATDGHILFTKEGYDSLVKPFKIEDNVIVFLKMKRNANDYHLGYSVGYLDFKQKNKNKNLENMPYLLGESDINRQLQMLPGIEQGNEGFSNLFVRGGEVDQNLMLYNGTPIYNSNHLFGVSSIFHNRSIENTAVYRGIAPAKYGGRASSVISLESKKLGGYTSTKMHGEAEMTPLNIGIYAEQIDNRKKSYYTISARRSWLDLLLPAEFKQNSFNANIYDLQFNYGKQLKNGDNIDFSIMNTRDHYFIGFTERDSQSSVITSLGLEQKWSNILGSLKYSQHLGNNFTAEHFVSYSGYKNRLILGQEQIDTLDFVNLNPSVTEQMLTRGVRDIGLQSNWVYLMNNKHRLSFGLQSSSRLFLIGRYDYSAKNFPNVADVSRVEGDTKYSLSQEIALYAEDKVRISDEAVLDIGLRNVIYSYDGYTQMVVEPRVHLTSFLKNNDVFKIAYNRHNQFVNELNLGQTGGPNNLWVPSTETIKPQAVNMLEAGYEKQLGSSYSASINIYLKTFNNLSMVSDLTDAGDPGLNWQDNVLQGSGSANGIELFLQKSEGQFTGWISYVYSNSVRQFEGLDEAEFLSRFDRPHMLKFYGNLTSDFRDWDFGFNFIIGSGQLFTLPIGKYRDIDGNTMLEYNTLNNYRSPNYQRLDLCLNRKKDVYGLDQEWRFYLYNALGSRNPINVTADFVDNSFTELIVNRGFIQYVPGIAYVIRF